MPVFKVFKRKLKRVGPVMVEGGLIKRTQVATKQAKQWVDRTIGYEARRILSRKQKIRPKQVMFITFQHEYACNPRYICEALLREGADVDIYWAVEDPLFARDLPDRANVHAVKINSYEYFEAAMSSRVIVINSLLGDKFYPFPVKKGQVVIETWHGSLGIKRFDLAHYNTNVSWPEAAKRTGELTTFCISNSSFEDSVFRETFWKNTRIVHAGHARNDIFFDTYQEERKRWKEKFLKENGLDEKVKLALYAPTFRDDHNFAVYDLQADRILDALEKRFGGEWRLLLRYHDNDKKTESQLNNVKSGRVIDVTSLPDIQELLSFVDAGITDYSSWIYDFILGGKPGFIYARDIELYNNERGFYFTLEESPFPVAKNNDEMEENILKFNDARYRAEVKKFLEDKGCIDDGHAGERVASLITRITQKKPVVR